MPTSAALESEFRELEPRALQLCAGLKTEIASLLDQAGIALANPIQTRVKTWDSLNEKLQRVQLEIGSVSEVQDIAGVRLILLFRRDLESVCEMIRTNLQIVREYDTNDRLKADQFGYSSRHFVVKLNEDWLRLPTMSSLGGLQAEIQVRTAAQHLWAESSQVLQYKRENTVPTSILRSVYRVSALLETVDLEFDRLLTARDSYRADVAAQPNEPQGPDHQMNVDLLEALLDRYFPMANKTDDEQYADALAELDALDLAAPAKVGGIIQKHLEQVLEDDRTYAAEAKLSHPVGHSKDRMEAGVFLSHIGLLRRCLARELGDAYNEYR